MSIRTAWFDWSIMSTAPEGVTARLRGPDTDAGDAPVTGTTLNVADSAGPSLPPGAPVPASVLTKPLGANTRSVPVPPSAMSRLPAPSTASPFAPPKLADTRKPSPHVASPLPARVATAPPGARLPPA